MISSSSTKSNPSGMIGLSLYLSFLTWNKTSTMYWTLLSIPLSFKIVRNRSKIPLFALAECSERNAPTSRINETAISTESSVGRSRRSTSIWRARTSWATCWLTSWPMKVAVAITAGWNTQETKFVSVRYEVGMKAARIEKQMETNLVVSFITLKELTNETVEKELSDLW